MHKAVRNARLFERIQNFEKGVIKRGGELSRADVEAQVGALNALVQALILFAPRLGKALLLPKAIARITLPLAWNPGRCEAVSDLQLNARSKKDFLTVPVPLCYEYAR